MASEILSKDEIIEEPEKPLKKFSILREHIANNTDIFTSNPLIELKPQAFTNPGSTPYFENVTIVISPNKAEFDPDKLKNFMDNLNSKIKFSPENTISETQEGGLTIGWLKSEETIATFEKKEFTTFKTDERERLKEYYGISLKDSVTKNTFEIKRKFSVMIYPDPISAKGMINLLTNKEDPSDKRNWSDRFHERHVIKKGRLQELKKLNALRK